MAMFIDLSYMYTSTLTSSQFVQINKLYKSRTRLKSIYQIIDPNYSVLLRSAYILAGERPLVVETIAANVDGTR